MLCVPDDLIRCNVLHPRLQPRECILQDVLKRIINLGFTALSGLSPLCPCHGMKHGRRARLSRYPAYHVLFLYQPRDILVKLCIGLSIPLPVEGDIVRVALVDLSLGWSKDTSGHHEVNECAVPCLIVLIDNLKVGVL